MVGLGEPPGTTVPLFTPSTRQLRAGAVWVTIANWGDALAERYGAAEIVTPAGRMTPRQARSRAFTSGSPGAVPVAGGDGPSRPLVTLMRTMAKDARWAGWAVDAGRRVRGEDLRTSESTPFVWQHHDLFQRAGFLAARRLGVPLVLFVDAPQVWEAARWGVARPGWGSALERVAERPQFLAADVVACVSEEVADQVLAITGGRANVLVTPCTAAPSRTDDRLTQRRRLGLEGRVVIGWVGSFRRFHHTDMLVRACAALGDEVDGVTLLMIGDGPMRAECSRLAEELGVDARFPGQVPNDEVVALLQACDVGVVPAAEGDSFHYSPLKLKEFMAAGLPTVVPAAGEMTRVLKPDVEALFYRPGDELELRTQMARLATDAELRRKIAAGGTARLSASFSMGDQIAELEQMLGRATFRLGNC